MRFLDTSGNKLRKNIGVIDMKIMPKVTKGRAIFLLTLAVLLLVSLPVVIALIQVLNVTDQLSLKELDFNGDGETTIHERWKGTRLNKRVIVYNSKQCSDYYDGHKNWFLYLRRCENSENLRFLLFTQYCLVWSKLENDRIRIVEHNFNIRSNDIGITIWDSERSDFNLDDHVEQKYYRLIMNSCRSLKHNVDFSMVKDGDIDINGKAGFE